MPPVRSYVTALSENKKERNSKLANLKKTSKVRTDAILSIKPEFARLIAQQSKNHEYRKYKMTGVERIWLYEIAPKSMLTMVMTTAPPKVPGEVQDPNGIGNEDFDAGRKESKFGYPVVHLHQLKEPLSITDLKRYGLSPPQGHMFAPVKLVEDFPLAQMTELF